MIDSRLSVLVVSCDKYADLWPLFFRMKDYAWSDCPFEFYLGSNFLTYNNDKNIHNISIGEDESWSDNLRKMLSQIPSEHVLFLLEDCVLDKKIDTGVVTRYLDYAIQHGLDCVRLAPVPSPGKILDREYGLAAVEPGMPYFICCQISIWKKSSLMNLLKPGYSAWDFELRNSRDKESYWLKIVSTKKYIFSSKNGVVKGKYLRSTVNYLEKQGISVDTSRRGIIEDTDIYSKLHLKYTRIKMWAYIKFGLYRYTWIKRRVKNI